jgi:dethiobiotin synthetase
MNQSIFITGTDTDIGKTFVSCLILKAFNDLGLSTLGLKPIASGCHENEKNALRSQDALYLQQYSSIKIDYETTNPFAFKEPIAPHIAASKSNTPLTKKSVCSAILSAMQYNADVNVIEGVGGWSVPLNNTELISEIVTELEIPIILVVGIKLGCLNHAILTHQQILASGGKLVGWVANCLAPDCLLMKENIETLKVWLSAPCLGIVAYQCRSTTTINIDAINQSLLL